MSHPHPDLGTPPAPPRGGLRITPLGGLGEIGRNMNVFEHAGRLLIVDCGVLFPEEHQPGVDVILPDFTSIRDRLDDIDAIVLTHGHEDHIGGVPYLLRERKNIPIVGSTLTLAFITAKLKEHRIKPTTIKVREGDRHTIGAFDLEFAAVNHSIPDGLAVAIRTPAVAAITAVLVKAAKEKIGDARQLEQLISRAIGQWVYRTHRRQPMIIPIVIDA